MFKSYAYFAINEAKKALKNNEVPVGAVAVYNGVVIAKAYNRVEKRRDKTAHAEMILIEKLRKIFQTTHFFNLEISVYITLEPCCMCTSALSICGVKNIFYLLEDEKFGGVKRVFMNSAYFLPNFYYTYNEEYHHILQSFFQKLRNSKDL